MKNMLNNLIRNMNNLIRNIYKFREIRTFLMASFFLTTLFFLLHEILKIPPLSPNKFKFVSDEIASSLIGITFTIFGFALTMRNLLVARQTSNYGGFSMRTIIDNSTNLISKSVWYLILTIPFLNLSIYFMGHRRCIYLFVFLSGICVVIFLSTVLHRLTKKNCRRTIEYIIIDNFFDTTELYKKEYRKEYFKQLIFDDSNRVEIQLTFIELLNILYDIIAKKDKYFKWYFPWYRLTRTAIQKNAQKKWKKMTEYNRIFIVKTFSEYSYIYFSNIICNYQESDYQNLLIQFNEIIRYFLNNNNLSIEIYGNYLKEKKMKIEKKYKKRYDKIKKIREKIRNSNRYREKYRKKQNKRYNQKYKKRCKKRDRNIAKIIKKRKNKYSYIILLRTLYFNLVFGLLCACTSKMDLPQIKDITKKIADTSIGNNLLLSDSQIKILSLFAIYYAKENELLSQKIQTKKLYEYIFELFNNTSRSDFEFFKKSIYEEFTIYDYSNHLNEIYRSIIKEKNQFHIPNIDFMEEY